MGAGFQTRPLLSCIHELVIKLIVNSCYPPSLRVGAIRRPCLRKLLPLLALCFVPLLAAADTFNWSYTGTNWDDPSDIVNASGTFTTDPFNGTYYQITGITGERNGVAITGLNDFGSADNELFPAFPAFDMLGLGYTAGGVEYNVYFDDIDFDEVHLEFQPFHQVDFDVPSISISAEATVPEPSSVFLLASGMLIFVRKFSRTKP